MSSFFKSVLSCGVAALLSLALSPAQANVVLTFDVSNVSLNTCSGAIQPTCTVTGAASFQQRVVIADTLLAPPANSSLGSILETGAVYGFPTLLTDSPWTAALRARVSAPSTSTQSFTQLDNSYDQLGGTGGGSAFMYTDLAAESIGAASVRTQQEYQLSYNLFSQFSDPLSYTDLVNQSLDAFFSKFIGSTTGTFDELGAGALLDPLTLLFGDYVFSEYRGDLMLVAVQVDPPTVPEPGSLALMLAAAIALLCSRRRQSRAHAACSRQEQF